MAESAINMVQMRHSKPFIDPHEKFKRIMLAFTIKCVLDYPKSIVHYAADYFQTLKAENIRMSACSDVEELHPEEVQRIRDQRHHVVYSEPYNPEEDNGSISFKIIPKTNEEKQALLRDLGKCLLFRDLDNDHKDKVIDAMFERSVVPNEIVIKQGDDGDNFYVVEEGIFEAYVEENESKKRINTYKNEGSFGELALMYNQARAATVIAKTAGRLWAMTRDTFRRIVVKSAFNKRRLYEKFIEKVPLLEPLSQYERMTLADALVPEYYSDGETIIEQGQAANGMYIIEKGNCKVMIFHKQAKQISVLGVGGYFGELALVAKKPRAATVIAIGDVKVAFLEVAAFERMLGPCMDIMKRQIELYDDAVQEMFSTSSETSYVRKSIAQQQGI